MDRAWGRMRAADLLDRTARQLASLGEPRLANGPLAMEVASLALLEGFDETRVIASRVVARIRDQRPGLSTRDLLLARWLPWRRAKLERRHPRYDPAALRFTVERGTIELSTVAGRFGDAEAAIATEYDWHLYAATRAFDGDLAGALAVIDRDAYPSRRRHTVQLVVCIEAFRRGDRMLAERLYQLLTPHEDCSGWTATFLAAGLLDRRPWWGYPFDDY